MKFKPSEMSAGGGLWSDVDATIQRLSIVWSNDTDYKSPNNIPISKLEVVDDQGVEYEQLLSCGGKGSPSEDGETIEGGADNININSNLALLIISLVNMGFPENRIEDKLSVFVGTKAHFERVAAPKRDGLPKALRADGKVFESTVLVVTKILKYPWDKAGAKGKAPAAAAAKGKAPAAKKTDSALESVADDTVMAILLEHEDGLTKQQLAVQVFNVVKVSHPDLKADVVKLVNTDAYHEGKSWTLEDGIVKMG